MRCDKGESRVLDERERKGNREKIEREKKRAHRN